VPDEILDVPAARQSIEWFRDYLGCSWVDQHLTKREKLKEKSGRWFPSRLHPNQLINLFACYHEDLATYGDQVFSQSPHSRCLTAHATNVKHVQAILTPRESEQLRSLLQNREKVEGFLYQCQIAAHYSRAGAEIVSFSLGGSNEGDIVVKSAGTEIELQCKSMEYGAGRKIHPNDFAILATEVINACTELGENVIIEVRCRNRYESGDRAQLLNYILKMLKNGEDKESFLGGYKIYLSFRESPIPWNEFENAQKPDPSKPLARAHVALSFETSGDVKELQALFFIRSEKQDKVVKAILRRAKQAAVQVSFGGPTIIFVHIPEFIPWNQIKSTGHFERKIADLADHPANKRVSALVFTSESASRDGNKEGFCLINREATDPLPPGFEILRGVVPLAAKPKRQDNTANNMEE